MQVNKVQLEIERTRGTLSATGSILKGSVSEVMLGKKKTTSGNRIAYLLTYKGDGNRTKSVYVKKNQLTEVKTMIANYRKLKTTLCKLAELNVKLFKTKQAIMRRKP
jgi:hypothetical protein